MHTPRSSASRHPSRSSTHASRWHTAPAGGRHELGQNFLVDRRVVERIAGIVGATHGPIVELGAGGGALTRPLARLGRPLTAVELDPRRAAALRRDLGRAADVLCADALTWRPPSTPHVVVSNIPFHITTAILRRLLDADHWTDAVLLAQWEVARRRSGIGGASMLTAQSAPWFEFELHGRVPARAFRPMPAVDGGLFTIRRRADPLVAARDRRAYSSYVASVFQGRGRGLGGILPTSNRPMPPGRVRGWLRERGLDAHVLPNRLTADDWGALWAEVRGR